MVMVVVFVVLMIPPATVEMTPYAVGQDITWIGSFYCIRTLARDLTSRLVGVLCLVKKTLHIYIMSIHQSVHLFVT
jgi:hypothetical protein